MRLPVTVFDEHRNLALGVVSAGSSIIDSESGTSLVASSDAEAATFPAVPFYLTVWRDQTPAQPAVEIVRATAFDGVKTFTVERAQQGTTAQAFISQGWKFGNTITAADIVAIEDAVTGGEAGLAAETAARESEDATLQANITAEASARASGDATTLASSETYTDGEVASEASTRAAADSTLQGNINAEATVRASGDAATLASAESYADGKVAAEATLRSAGDATTLSSAETYTDGQVSSEASARSAGDASTLTSAEGYTDSQVTAEATLRAAGDTATLSSAETHSDSALAAKTFVSLADVAPLGLTDEDVFAWNGATSRLRPVNNGPMDKIVVAASNSRRDTFADVKADGSHDEEALLAALELCTGPTVVELLDGTFEWGGVLALASLASVPAGIRIKGLGKGITTIAGDPGAGVSVLDLSLTSGHTLSHFGVSDLTIDATGFSDVGMGGQSVLLGLIRDIGAGNFDHLTFEKIEFLIAHQWSLTPIAFNSDTGLGRWLNVNHCEIVTAGVAHYGVQVRKPTQHVWLTNNDWEADNNGLGLDIYNAYALYAGCDDFHVIGNGARTYQGHSPISCSPAHNGEIIGNNVAVTVADAGEAGIEVQFKLGHGADADTSHDIVVAGNSVKGAYWNIVVDNENDATNPTQRPYNIKVFGNPVSGATTGIDTYLHHGDHGVSAWNSGVVQQDSTCVGTITPGSDLGGPVLVAGGGVSEVQQLVVANATGGTLTLTDHGLVTAAIAFNATAAAVQTALRALAGIGTGVLCSGGPLGTAPVTITFQNTLANRDVPQLSAASSLTGVGATATVTTVTPGTPVVAPTTKTIFGGQHIFVAPLGRILFANAADTTVQSGLFRDENNVIRLGHGGGRDMIVGDTSGRIGIGDAFINPSSVDSAANYPAIVVKVPNSATRFVVAAGPIQATAGTGGTPIDLASFLDNANGKLAGITNTGALDMKEQTDPALPATDTARVYARDNGAGKTQLVVVFNTGAVQVLATQP